MSRFDATVVAAQADAVASSPGPGADGRSLPVHAGSGAVGCASKSSPPPGHGRAVGAGGHTHGVALKTVCAGA